MASQQRAIASMPIPVTDTSTAIATHLASRGVPPVQAWLDSFMSTARVQTPLPALRQTALFRLLATDLTTTVRSSQSTVFPAGITDPAVREQRIPGPIAVQLLDIEDIGRSRWSQVEALEAHERGETTKGREIIRVVPEVANGPPGSTQAPNASSEKSFGPHKLLLQDVQGTKVYAIELTAVNNISVGMLIGTKLLLKDFTVARGVLLLEPRSCEVLGGKVDVWEKQWREDRKTVLKEKAGMQAIV